MKKFLFIGFLFFTTLVQAATVWEYNADNTSASTSGNSYENRTNITTTLNIPNATQLIISVLGSTEKNYDFLYITDTNGITQTFDGTIDTQYTAAGPSVTLQFVSDRSVTQSGVTITISDVNSPPSIISDTLIVTKYTGDGTTVGTVYTTSPATTFQILSGNDDGIFTINNLGIITVLNSSSLSATLLTSYTLSIKATNNFGSGTGDITIDISTEPIVNSNERNFSIRNPINTRNIKGNYQMIGNTVLCVTDSDGKCYDYTGTLRNNDLSLSYIDTDNVSYTLFDNSSQAEINIPPNAIVKWAAIYTQGQLTGTSSTTDATNILKDPLKITIPNIVNTFDSVPTYIDMLSSGGIYSTFSQITEINGKTGSEINGMMTVARVKAYEGKETGLGNYGAWSVVIIYEDQQETLKNISIFDGYKEVYNNSGNVDININGFLTPTSGDVESKVSIFVGEGDKNIQGDKLYFNDVNIGHIDPDDNQNAFYSNTSGFVKDPDYSNNQGIDIQNYNVGKSGALGSNGDGLIGNGDTSALITLTSTGDYYLPSVVAFSTTLYEPRVCYNQNFYAEDGSALSNVSIGDTILVEVWISNMKKIDPITGLPEIGDLETADKVEITMDLDTEYLEYLSYDTTTTDVFQLKNIDNNSYTSRVYTTKTNTVGDDEIDYFADINSTKWRVGNGASATDGGQLLPNTVPSDDLKAFVRFKAKLLKDGNITINNIYKVSYENSLLGVRFGDESPLNIGVCADFNSSIGVGGLLGAYNIVNASGGGAPYDDATSEQTWLTTQVAGRTFNVNIISVNGSGDGLSSTTEDIQVSLIDNPYGSCAETDNACKQAACDAASDVEVPITIAFDGTVQSQSFTFNSAHKNAMFKITYNAGANHACSVDSFAIRPDKLTLTAPIGENIGFLKSAVNYNLTLTAPQYDSVTPTLAYNVDSSVFVVSSDKYQPDGTLDNALLGTFNFATTGAFNIVDGTSNDGAGNSEVVGINFDDVGLINLKLEDQTWASIDINNGDTAPNCAGAYICGNINATFIPDHFTLTLIDIHDNNDDSFTYFSNDLTESAKISLTVTAENFLNATTQNFKTASWENPVDITFTVPQVNGTNANKLEMDTTINLNFTAGSKALPWDNAIPGQQLHFNYPRTKNTPINPTRVDGAVDNVTLTASSLYGAVNIVSPATVAAQDATFVYGRTHAPRQRFVGPNGTALIYYESYCSGVDATGTVCTPALLPDGAGSRSTDDPRWFVNTTHNPQHGNAGVVTHNSATTRVTAGGASAAAPSQVALTYDVSRGYPYKATMQNTASSWLIYNPYNAGDNDNEFQVEFDNGASSWAGVQENNTTTNADAATRTNRRSMW